MTLRILPPVLLALALVGCGTAGSGQPVPRAAVTARAAGAPISAQQAIAAFERMPAKGLTKRPAPIRIAPITEGNERRAIADPPSPLPGSILKIQALAITALLEAEQQESWNDRWMVTDAALQKIDAVKLASSGLSNVPAKVGQAGARAYGYLGLPPTHENRYKVQVVALGFLRANHAEATLAKGAPIFRMATDMLEVTTGWDQGFRVGVSVLNCLKENYKDRQIARSCQEILTGAAKAPTKEEAYGLIVDGLQQLAEKVAH